MNLLLKTFEIDVENRDTKITLHPEHEEHNYEEMCQEMFGYSYTTVIKVLAQTLEELVKGE